MTYYIEIIKGKHSDVRMVATTLLLLFCSLYGVAQDSLTVSGQFIGNTQFAQVVMKKFEVGSSFPVGGAKINGDDFSLTLPPDIPEGVYRFQYGFSQGEKYVDIIINGKDKDIQFTLQANEPFAFPQFTSSTENQQWYAYLEETNKQFQRVELLTQFINSYPDANAPVVKAAEQAWTEEKSLYLQNFEAFKRNTQSTWACEMVANKPYYFTNPKDDYRLQDYYKREHFWDGFDGNNPDLINTPLYTEQILNYLRYWMNPEMNFSEAEQTAGFKSAVDVILRVFSGNEETKEFAYRYLTLGFKEIGQEEVLQYLDENYQDLAKQCFDTVEKTAFDKRMEGYAAMKVGNKAPDFGLTIQGSALKAKSLYDVQAEKTLLVFWSSTCPHCTEELPKINEWAAQQNGVKVVTVSVDTDSSLHTAAIAKFPNLIHTCDYKGWETEAASNYFIAATPTLILLDSEKRIEGKFPSWHQLLKTMDVGIN